MYLSSRALEGLKQYQYKPAGYTILDDLHTPLWNWAVQRLPMWLAPNLITLTGTMGLVISYLVNMAYTPDFIDDERAPPPRWIYLLSAFSVWFYCQLDCLDGKQARRTKTSSPLGQLFDHGCDALSVNLLLANLGCSLSMPCSWTHALGNFGVMFTWILAQWEEYHTGIMLYGNSYYGVLEANYSICIFHIITFIKGPAFWRRPVIKYLPLETLQTYHIAFIKDWALNELGIIVMITVGGYQALCNLYRVFTYDPATMPAKERGHKQLGKLAAFLHFVILSTMLGLGCAWLWKETEQKFLCREENATFGVVFGLIASQIIVAHMCKEPFKPAIWAISALAVGAVNSRLRLVDEFTLTSVLLAGCLFGYLHYVFVVIGQITQYLDIYCLTIKHKAA